MSGDDNASGQAAAGSSASSVRSSSSSSSSPLNNAADGVRSFKWKVDEIRTTRTVITYKSEEFSCKVAPLKTLCFHLLLKIRENFYELYMESLMGYDVELRLAVSIESNGYRRTKQPFDLTAPGAVDGASQHESILWGNLEGLFQGGGVHSAAGANNDNVSLPAATVTVNIFTMQKYQRPQFVQADGNSLSKDMAVAFDNETEANLDVVCLYRPEDQEIMEGEDVPPPLEKTFRVQRGILASRSDVFAAMFTHDFLESSSNQVLIKDMGPGALCEFLRFLYSDTVRDIKTHAMELLMAANKYDVPKLKALCEQALCEDLDDDRVIKVAMVAHEHGAERATDFTVDAIAANFPDVIEREMWKELVERCPELLVKVHKKIADRMVSLASQVSSAQRRQQQQQQQQQHGGEFRPRRVPMHPAIGGEPM